MPLPKLDGEQHKVVYLETHGHHLIQGTAGSGKSVMAILRAGYLTRELTPNHGPTLLLTHDNSLVNYLRYLAEGRADAVTVETYHRFARGYLNGLGLMGYGRIAGDDADTYLTAAIAEVRAQYLPSPFFERPLEFFVDELGWIGGMGIREVGDYLAVQRAGRKEALQPKQREAVWKIRNVYLRIRDQHGKDYDWWDLASSVKSSLASDLRERRYKHIVVDEAQDFSPEIVRSLVAALRPGGSITVFMDQSQQIYGQRTSWQTWGLQISKVHEFTENYRNSPEIAAVAAGMASMNHFQDTQDFVMPQVPRRAAGAKPTLFIAGSPEEEMTEVRRQVATLGRTARVAVLSRRREGSRRLVRGIENVRVQQIFKDMPSWDDEPGVYFGTFYAAKGLEFEAVFVPFADASLMPEVAALEAHGENDAFARESRLLYVAVTRARSELLVSFSSGELTRLLPDRDDPMWSVVVGS